jgi:hypothetical protein
MLVNDLILFTVLDYLLLTWCACELVGFGLVTRCSRLTCFLELRTWFTCLFDFICWHELTLSLARFVVR